MRISDWSSDVCSSDLYKRCSAGTLRPRRTWRVERSDRQAQGCGQPGPDQETQRMVSQARKPEQAGPAFPAAAAGRSEASDGSVRQHNHAAIRRASGNPRGAQGEHIRSEEHTSELQSLMRISYAVFCLKNNKKNHAHKNITTR